MCTRKRTLSCACTLQMQPIAMKCIQHVMTHIHYIHATHIRTHTQTYIVYCMHAAAAAQCQELHSTRNDTHTLYTCNTHTHAHANIHGISTCNATHTHYRLHATLIHTHTHTHMHCVLHAHCRCSPVPGNAQGLTAEGATTGTTTGKIKLGKIVLATRVPCIQIRGRHNLHHNR